ncbi:hypothetical protein [Streptomyces sp. SJL17-4]
MAGNATLVGPGMTLCEICNPWGSLGVEKPPLARKLPGGGTA